jgi:hypothetical protein
MPYKSAVDRRECQRRYAEKNRKKLATKAREYHAQNPQAHKERVFRWRKENADKYKLYWRSRQLRIRYGLTLAQYHERYTQQEGNCAICKKPFSTLLVDHNHTSGKVRGLLCKRCNFFLGYMEGSSLLVKEAEKYLDGYK